LQHVYGKYEMDAQVMSPHKLRKTRKLRGTRTVGWGQVGQHRKHGQKGGRKVGRHKGLWTYIIRYEPDYFGKKGFKTPPSLKTTVNVINIGQLDELTAKLNLETQLTKKVEKPSSTSRHMVIRNS